MAQTFYPITPTEIVAGAANEWVTMNASALIPEGATGVILHIRNTHGYTKYEIGLRKNGSSDDRHVDLWDDGHCWATIGVDASRYFEAYVESTTQIDIYVVGYTMAGVTFATNADDMSLGVTDSWQPIDCSTEAPNAIGLIWEVYGSGGDGLGLRKNGSSDDRVANAHYHSCFSAIIGCDAGQICEGYIEDLAVDLFLSGYITDGATFNLNATDVSLPGNTAWLDLAALPAGANMGFIEVYTPNLRAYGLRKNDEAEDFYSDVAYHCWGIVECDASQIIEGKIEDTAVDFFVVGYSTVPAGETYELSCTDGLVMGEPATTAQLTIGIVVTDGLKSGDTSASLGVFNALAGDGTVLSEALATLLETYPVLTDGLIGSDTSVMGLLWELLASDGLELSDTLTHLFETNPALTDGLKLSDAIDVFRTLGLSSSDGIKIGEAISHLFETNPSLVDGVKLSDSSVVGLVYGILVAIGVKLSDLPIATTTLDVLASSGIKLSDATTIYLTIALALADGVKLSEATISTIKRLLAIVTATKRDIVGFENLRRISIRR